MTVALAHDFIYYCKYNRSPVYIRFLDVEGEFDSILRGILFKRKQRM